MSTSGMSTSGMNQGKQDMRGTLVTLLPMFLIFSSICEASSLLILMIWSWANDYRILVMKISRR